MQIGITLPQFGESASPEALERLAIEAERLGYDSLWASERILWPLEPRTPYGGAPGASWPEHEAIAFDPLETLAYVAAKTERIQLGTAVIDALFHAPVVLARRLATLDQLSRGRVIAGLGQGWAVDEFEATNVPYKRRGAGFTEFVKALRACWSPDPVSFSGRFYKVPRSRILPKPAQEGGIPVIVGAMVPKAIVRAAEIADGLTPIAASWETLESAIRLFRSAAEEAGRDPRGLRVVVCGSSYKTWPEAEARPPLNGTLDEIRRDLERTRSLGVDHVYFAVNYGHVPLQRQLERVHELAPLLDERG